MRSTVGPRFASETVAAELASKIAILRRALAGNALGGIRLRGQDWFAWTTCGGSNAVLLASERGVAEVLVTASSACVLADTIDGERLRAEELPEDLESVEFAWARPDEREAFVRDVVGGAPVASDLPSEDEQRLPDELTAARLLLRSAEIERYRALGMAAAEAMTETLTGARPELTELDLAGRGAAALLRRGIDPALVLVGGSRRLPLYRHPQATGELIGDRATVVFCGRRWGLYANLTRFVYFREPTPQERCEAGAVAQVEAAAWDASRPGATLAAVYDAIADAYAGLGFPGAELGHHQGGITGYRSREVLAAPGSSATIDPPVALAWNPSLPGSKIEDTVIRSAGDVEVLTVDPVWPTVVVEGRRRPDLLVR